MPAVALVLYIKQVPRAWQAVTREVVLNCRNFGNLKTKIIKRGLEPDHSRRITLF
jgi:hypothetical protein